MKKQTLIIIGLFFLIGFTGQKMACGQANKAPQGAINGLFSISEDQQVYFSKGNLQYIGSAKKPYWKFADHQWDIIGNAAGNGDPNIDRDLFSWGTSGFEHGAVCYQPWSTDWNPKNYYAYGGAMYNLNAQGGTADWGANPISNGGNVAKQWRTLTYREWAYLLHYRKTESGILFAMAQVNGVNGLIILPDDWSRVTFILQNKNDDRANYSSNVISLEEWETIEKKGAVFLPSATWGRGYYWTSSVFFEKEQARPISIQDGRFMYTGIFLNKNERAWVRLVCPAK